MGMEKPTWDKTRLGFESTCSPAHANLTKQTDPLANKGINTIKFVKSQDQSSKLG